MSGIFSNNSAATLLKGSQSSLAVTQQQFTQAFQENAGLDTQQAQLTEQISALNAENAAIEGRQVMDAQSQAYNNSGVTQQGTPGLVRAQTQHLAQEQVTNIIDQGQLSSQGSLIQANQTLNSGYAALLGQNNQYLTQLAQAKIASSMQMYNGFSADIMSGINLLFGGPTPAAASPTTGSTGAGGSTGVPLP